MEGLSLDNILGEEQINNLFSGKIGEESTEESTEDTSKDTSEEDTEETKATEIDPNNLFDNQSESVGSEEEIKEKEDIITNKSDTSKNNFYSSIANALVEDGVLQNLNEEDLSKVKSAEDFAELMSTYITSQLGEQQKRIAEALKVGVEPTEIQKYENYIATLNNIDEARLSSEDDAGENLRKNIIYQDCLNKGFSKERAIKMVEKSIKAGTDIEDAIEALNDNKKFFKTTYDNLVLKAKKEFEEEQNKYRKQAENLKNSILNEDKAFGSVTVDKSTRQKVYDSIMKPVYTDPESGDKLTAIQKYELDNRTEFLKNVGLLYVLTDGFKSIDRLVNDKVKKETKKSLRNLERTINSSNTEFRGGNLSFANNSGDEDLESFYKGWKLSI